MQVRRSAVGVLAACLLMPVSAFAQSAPTSGTPHPGVVFLPAPAASEQAPDDVAAAPVPAAPTIATNEMLPDEPPPVKPKQHDHWYGGQTLLVDGAGAALVLGGIAAAKSGAGGVMAGGGILTYFLGAPIVHLAHGEIGPAFGSLALRIGVPAEFAFDGVFIGAALDSNKNGSGDGGLIGAGVGFATGMVTAMVLDSALLAHEKVDDQPDDTDDAPSQGGAKSPVKEAKSRVSPLHVDWMPTAAPIHGGAAIGLVGSF